MPPHQPANSSTTLITTKSTFLTRQILLLSTPLTLPYSQPSSNPSSIDTLPTTTSEPLLEKINKRITTHNRLHFPLQTQRHILEQVEAIYWRDVLASGLPVTKPETLVGRDVDFTREEGVQSLEAGWDGIVLAGSDSTTNTNSIHEDNEHDQRQRFTSLHKTLRARVDRRDHLRKKLRALKELRRRLEPFEKPKENIQPNLVGNGNKEIEGEVARMRVLLVRAEGAVRERQERRERAGRGRGSTEDGEVQMVDGGSDLKRVQDLLELG